MSFTTLFGYRFSVAPPPSVLSCRRYFGYTAPPLGTILRTCTVAKLSVDLTPNLCVNPSVSGWFGLYVAVLFAQCFPVISVHSPFNGQKYLPFNDKVLKAMHVNIY